MLLRLTVLKAVHRGRSRWDTLTSRTTERQPNMPYIAIGIIGGFISAFIASGKRRSAAGWFVIGFLLPLIGIILAIVLPAGTNDLEMDAMLATPHLLTVSRDNSIEVLERLAALRDRGALTAEEFETKKRELLASVPSP
ncbi:MAG TPA: SHOCT domain-containing protein, partial [Kofleriaceae bacterium]|nr:SHOCT domain-containing protein [Kofleriaceae bacterium]